MSAYWKFTSCQAQIDSGNAPVKKLDYETFTQWNILSHKKEENFMLLDSMGGPVEHYGMWNKPVRERKIPNDFTYM